MLLGSQAAARRALASPTAPRQVPWPALLCRPPCTQATRGAISAALQKLQDSDGEDSDLDDGTWDMAAGEVEVRC